MQKAISKNSNNNNKNHPMARRPRRKKIKLRPGHPSDAELISEYLKNSGTITKCPPGYAIGSLPSSCHGLE